MDKNENGLAEELKRTFYLVAAILVGQILSELLSNAIKHAFLENEAGVINISLQRTDKGQIELSLADNGVGLPENSTPEKLCLLAGNWFRRCRTSWVPESRWNA